jgi:large subunit ribosomal protein L30
MVNTSSRVRDTLKSLNIETRFRATLVPDTPSYRGMLQRAKDHISWCYATRAVIKALLEKRGRKEGWKLITNEDLTNLGFESFDSLAQKISDSSVLFYKLENIKPSFTLSSPRGGFKKSIRRNYGQGGILGANPELPKVVEKML